MVVPSHCLGVERERTAENSKLPGSDRGTVIMELKQSSYSEGRVENVELRLLDKGPFSR